VVAGGAFEVDEVWAGLVDVVEDDVTTRVGVTGPAGQVALYKLTYVPAESPQFALLSEQVFGQLLLDTKPEEVYAFPQKHFVPCVTPLKV